MPTLPVRITVILLLAAFLSLSLDASTRSRPAWSAVSPVLGTRSLAGRLLSPRDRSGNPDPARSTAWTR
ncbi:MAG: hypothetical protein C0183_05960, partial [Roseiflexus castenholzii]